MTLLLLLTACARPAELPASVAGPATPQLEVRFEGVPVPLEPEDQRAIRAGAPGFYAVARVGDVIGDGRFGVLLDASGQPIADGDHPALCNSNDFNGLLQAHGALLLVSHFECTPGAIYLTGLNQDAENHHLAPLWTQPVDLSGVRGGALHCAGDITPWGTHLASEEYEVNARTLSADGTSPDNYQGYNAMAAYFGGSLAGANVYDYGWLPEVEVLSASGASQVSKRYAMGRLSHELGLVMPDGRTVYETDDGINGGFFMFVADREGDLSSGALYAARWDQQRAGSGGRGEAEITWVPLGHAEQSEIERWLTTERLGFGDLFEVAEASSDEAPCPAGFESVSTTWGRECLRLKPGMAQAASRLETRRYAALMGATTEFTKSEGLTWDPDRGQVYVAFSRVEAGMTAGHTRDRGGRDDVQLTTNRCGVIYGFAVADGQLDSLGAPIDSPYVGASASAVLAGTPRTYSGPPWAGKGCDVDGVANPDNIAYLPGQDLLLMAEDSSYHVNNALWAANLETGALTRVMTAPLGAELSGLHWFPDIGGAGYLTVTVQHPFRRQEASEAERRSTAGYIGPFLPR